MTNFVLTCALTTVLVLVSGFFIKRQHLHWQVKFLNLYSGWIKGTWEDVQRNIALCICNSYRSGWWMGTAWLSSLCVTEEDQRKHWRHLSFATGQTGKKRTEIERKAERYGERVKQRERERTGGSEREKEQERIKKKMSKSKIMQNTVSTLWLHGSK